MVGHLDDQRARRTAVGAFGAAGTPDAIGVLPAHPAPLALHAAHELDVGARVHNGVGDEFADDHEGVIGEPVVHHLGAVRSEFGPFGECGANEVPGGSWSEWGARQRGAGDGVLAGAVVRGRIKGTRLGLPLRRNGPHGAAP